MTTVAGERDTRACRVLYVSPLKALTYDVERNLRGPLAGITLEAERRGLPAPAIKVATRTGDTPQADRRDIVRHPPDILITTPESLYLSSRRTPAPFLPASTRDLDDIHSVAATKRGASPGPVAGTAGTLTAQPPQRIVLSQPNGPLMSARFLVSPAGLRHQHWEARPVPSSTPSCASPSSSSHRAGRGHG